MFDSTSHEESFRLTKMTKRKGRFANSSIDCVQRRVRDDVLTEGNVFSSSAEQFSYLKNRRGRDSFRVDQPERFGSSE